MALRALVGTSGQGFGLGSGVVGKFDVQVFRGRVLRIPPSVRFTDSPRHHPGLTGKDGVGRIGKDTPAAQPEASSAADFVASAVRSRLAIEASTPTPAAKTGPATKAVKPAARVTVIVARTGRRLG
jgi:hypothetical protein